MPPYQNTSPDDLMNMFGQLSKRLTVEQIYNTLRYHLSKEEMVELGEKLLAKGAQF
jgi:hypothetical protein